MPISSDPPIFQSLGLFDGQSDVGAVRQAGSARYDAATGRTFVAGSGFNMWLEKDQFHFVWKKMTGDFIVSARAQFLGEGVDSHRKMGWIARTNLETDSPHINAVVHGDGLTSLQFRRVMGATTEEAKSPITGADVIQLARRGTTYTMSVARFGDAFTTTEVAELDLGAEIYVGLFVCSHNDDVVETAVFDNVRLVVPAGDDLVPYRDYLGSHLEIMDIQSGTREIIHSESGCFEAPNWTPDGKSLIYNSKGRLYRFDLQTRAATLIETDFAIRNNNDHVLTFDGALLGLSHHSEKDGKSVVYVMPGQGGTPRRVTPNSPSYLHGWSPDNRFVVYTGERNGQYDIYKIDIDGGDEIRLTEAPGLDDGSEYSPDGQFIYFNSTRNGLMQLFRMKPDGSAQEQLTDDAWNNWFPHVSPDGKWIAFLSYDQDVEPASHPYYKHVTLRLMPVSGDQPDVAQPRVVAYLYGGQGTINVPSWSPDSKKVAFVSNSGAI